MAEFQPPELERLQSALANAMASVGWDKGDVRILDRAPLPFASTSPSEVLTCSSHGGVMHVLCKYAGVEGRKEHDSRQGTSLEAFVYRHLLPNLGVTRPVFYGAHIGDPPEGTWLFLEFLPGGTRLNLSPTPGVIRSAAQWLGTFHARAERHLLNGSIPNLERWNRDTYLGWARRTEQFTAPMSHEYPWLKRACAQFSEVAEALSNMPPTIVHGEYYPKNILVDAGGIVPVDWESASVGAGQVDLASLIEGWDTGEAQACVVEYCSARWREGPPVTFVRDLLAAQIYWQVRWLGTTPHWSIAERMRPRIHALKDLAARWDRLSSA